MGSLVAAQPDQTALADRENRNRGLGARASVLVEEAGIAIQQQRIDDAARALAAAAAFNPNHPEVLRLRAVVELINKNYGEAVTLLRQAVATKPEDALIQNNLGSALGESGDIDGAMTAFRASCALAPHIATAWFNLGKALEGQAYTREAEATLAHALELDPTHLPARVTHAQTLRALGKTDAAATEYRRALAINPEYLPAICGLTYLKSVALSAAETATLGRIYTRRDLDKGERVNVGFALMQTLEAQGREREAFAVVATANATRRRQLKWDAKAFSLRMKAIAAAFVNPVATSAEPTQGGEVIFIVSMPRSGSTLTEQILAAHPQVEGANEIAVLPNIIEEESHKRGVQFPYWVAQASPSDWDRLGKSYLAQTVRWRKSRPRFTDKALSNWQYAGAIRSMLPAARIVNCRRDPVETCLSCFRHSFGNDQQAFTYDLDELAAFWRDWDQLSRIWQARIPGAFRTLVYEELLADPEAQIRKLLDFCGLPFDEACLRSHEVEREVRTASAAQVREPMRRDTARAARYGDLLAPLRRALGVA